MTEAQPDRIAEQCTNLGWLRAPSRRALDVLISGCALSALIVPFLLIGGLVRLTSPGPAIYASRRVGKGGRAFRMYKFRSMVVGADQQGPLITSADDPRVTRLGRWLRQTKLDELPALWNVLIGDMSLVGPRPENPRSVGMYTEYQRRVLTVRPGLTSLASIRYRNEEAILGGGAGLDERYFAVMQDKLRLDLAYLESASAQLDLRILVRTLAVLFGVGPSHA